MTLTGVEGRDSPPGKSLFFQKKLRRGALLQALLSLLMLYKTSLLGSKGISRMPVHCNWRISIFF